MKKLIIRPVLVCACMLTAAIAIDAQTQEPQNDKSNAPGASSSGTSAVDVPVIIVGTAAKATWATTKFTARHVAKPVGKAVLVKATPAIARFALRNSAKYLLPVAVKLSLL